MALAGLALVGCSESTASPSGASDAAATIDATQAGSEPDAVAHDASESDPSDGALDATGADVSNDASGDAGAESVVGPFWASWPMPNDANDVEGGAPNLLHYTANGDGTVTDDVTHLVWQQPMNREMLPWGDAATPGTAQAYCAGLSLGGRSGWRVPDAMELVSLVDPSEYQPSIEETYFPLTLGDTTWTSNHWAGSSQFAWTVTFGGGEMTGLAPPGSAYVRCVWGAIAGDGGAPPPRYTINAGTVTDALTALTWQQSPPSGNGKTWGSAATTGTAQSYCASLALAGGGWRLPTMKELLTLVDFQVPEPGPMIDPAAFPGASADTYWSATVGGSGLDLDSGFLVTAWTVTLLDGAPETTLVSDPLAVRCVR